MEEACKGVEIAVMVGGFPRKGGMERKDVMSKNVSIYKSQASALEKHAAKNVKVCAIYLLLRRALSFVQGTMAWHCWTGGYASFHASAALSSQCLQAGKMSSMYLEPALSTRCTVSESSHL